MTNIGKIASLPPELREQLNQRLDRSEPGETILAWLNSHPEVQPLIATRFQGKPISKQNLSEYKIRCFRAWRMRCDAASFTNTLSADCAGLQHADSESVTDSLARWLGVRYLALAQAVADAPAASPEAELKRLRKLSRDILELRCSEHLAARVKLAGKRYELTQQVAIHAGHIPNPNPPPPEPSELYPTAMDLLRWQVFGDAVLPELQHPQYEHPACLI